MHNKTVKVCAIVCAILFVSALAGTVITLVGGPAEQIEILLGDELLYSGNARIDGEPLRINAEKGEEYNLIRIDDRGVCVEEANCRGQVCVRMGYLKSAYMPIVCLPHRLVIRYKSSANSKSKVDAVSE